MRNTEMATGTELVFTNLRGLDPFTVFLAPQRQLIFFGGKIMRVVSTSWTLDFCSDL